ncbi:MAG: 50S ribosomal protein L25 [Planctomycetaceae bacterium]
MAEVPTLKVQPRTAVGTAAARKLRREGIVPGNIFGHQQDPHSVQMTADDVRTVLSTGARVVDLVVDGKSEKALVSEVQWDTFAQHLIHVDFMRVDPNERVHLKVPVHLRGTAPGQMAGGVVEQPHHEVTVECLAVDVPKEIIIKIGELQLEGIIHVSDLTELPSGVKIMDAADTILVHISKPREEEDADAGEGSTAEPELIGKKPKEGEEAAPAKK